MVSTPKDGDRHGGQGEKGSEPIPSGFDEMIRHQFFPLGVIFMIITEAMRHAMVIRLTIMRVVSILVLSSISPAMSSTYMAKSKKNSVQGYGTPIGSMPLYFSCHVQCLHQNFVYIFTPIPPLGTVYRVMGPLWDPVG